MSDKGKTDLSALIRKKSSKTQSPTRSVSNKRSLSDIKKKFEGIKRSKPQSVRLVWCVDKTGSMSALIDKALQASGRFFDRMEEQNIQIEVKWAPFGDYCEYPSEGKSGLLEEHSFTANPEVLKQSIQATSLVGGGDADEAYEYVLAHVANISEPVSALVLIGDANPHPLKVANDQVREYNVPTTFSLNWRENAKELGKKNIPVYAFAMRPNCKQSFNTIAELSGGVSGDLDDIESLLDMLALTAVSLSKGNGGLDDYMERYGRGLAPAALGYAEQLRLEHK